MSLHTRGTIQSVAFLQKGPTNTETGFEQESDWKITDCTNSKLKKKKKGFRCGSIQHLASYAGFPAKVAQCSDCKTTGHFTKVCHSNTSNQSVHVIQMLEVPVLRVDRMSPIDKCQKKCTVTVSASASRESQAIELMLHTGSAVSIQPICITLEVCHLLNQNYTWCAI